MKTKVKTKPGRAVIVKKGIRTARTPRARATFAKVLEETCNVTEAARQAGISRNTAYLWKHDDPTFAQAWIDAEEAAVDKLEQVAFERARAGLSDRMHEILLKAHRPKKYQEKYQLEHTGPGGGAIVTVNMSVEQAAKLYREKLG